MLVVPLLHLHYTTATQTDALMISMKSSMSSRRSFSSQLPVEDFCVCLLLTMKFHQPSQEFTFGVDMSFIPYPLVITPVV
jgi:hypothetical protein